MKRQRDIFDLIRDNQHKLNEKPSDRSWSRLERRLDAHRYRGQRTLYRSLALVAGLAAIIAVTSLILVLVDQDKPDYLAYNGVPQEMEELTFTDVDREALKVVEFSRKYHDRGVNIVEGKPNQRLLPTAMVSNTTKKEASVTPITQFNWLIGDWQEKKGLRTSIEKWRLNEEGALVGEGALLENGKAVFTEKLKINEEGKNIFLSTQLESGKNPIRYQLISSKSGITTFENKSVEFPKQIVIQQHSAGHFSTVYQNTDPILMSSSQVEYMENRNEISSQQVSRTMIKMPLDQ